MIQPRPSINWRMTTERRRSRLSTDCRVSIYLAPHNRCRCAWTRVASTGRHRDPLYKILSRRAGVDCADWPFEDIGVVNSVDHFDHCHLGVQSLPRRFSTVPGSSYIVHRNLANYRDSAVTSSLFTAGTYQEVRRRRRRHRRRRQFDATTAVSDSGGSGSI